MRPSPGWGHGPGKVAQRGHGSCLKKHEASLAQGGPAVNEQPVVPPHPPCRAMWGTVLCARAFNTK